MRTYAKAMSATQRNSCHERGFTLIELLVSIVIIGIVLSIAVLSLSLAGNDRDVRREAQRLITILEIAQDDAVLQGREFGIEFTTTGYRFVEYDPFSERWLEIPGEDLLRLRSLPEDYELSLYLEDKRITLDDDPVDLEEEDDFGPSNNARNYAPHVMIFSSGDMTPFELHINRLTDELTVAMHADLLGNLEFLTDEERQL